MFVQNREPYLKVRYYVIRAIAREKNKTVSTFLWRANALIKNGPISNKENEKILVLKINARARENRFNGNPA